MLLLFQLPTLLVNYRDPDEGEHKYPCTGKGWSVFFPVLPSFPYPRLSNEIRTINYPHLLISGGAGVKDQRR